MTRKRSGREPLGITPKAKAAAEKGIEKVEASRLGPFALPAIEAALNLVPHAGPFLASYFGEVRNRRVVERIKKYIELLSDAVRQLEEDKIDYTYLGTEEFAEMVAQGADLASRSATERKIRRFANIIANHAALDFKFRSRTQSIMNFVDRLSDLDAFVLITYGPIVKGVRADSKEEAFQLVKSLADYIGQPCPSREQVIESIIYLDNLGLTWVNEKLTGPGIEKGEDLILKEFSSFRTPLGTEVVSIILPPNFFMKSAVPGRLKLDWPRRCVNPIYRRSVIV